MNYSILKNMTKKELENFYDTYKGSKVELFYQIVTNIDLQELNKNFLKRMIIQNLSEVTNSKEYSFKVDIYLKIVDSLSDEDLIMEITDLILSNLKKVLGNTKYNSDIKKFISKAVIKGYVPSKITEKKFFDYITLDLIMNSKNQVDFLKSSLPFIKENISNLYIENPSLFNKIFLKVNNWQYYVAYIFLGNNKIYNNLIPKRMCDEFPNSLFTYIKENGLSSEDAYKLDAFFKKYSLYISDIVKENYMYFLKNGYLYSYILDSKYINSSGISDETLLKIQKFYRDLSKELKENFTDFISKNNSKLENITSKYVRYLYDNYEFSKLCSLIYLDGLTKDEKDIIKFFGSLPLNGRNFFIDYFKKNHHKSSNIIKDFCLYTFKNNRLDIITYNISCVSNIDLSDELKEVLSLYHNLSYENKLLFTNYLNGNKKSKNIIKDFIDELFLSGRFEELDRLYMYKQFLNNNQNSILIMYFRCSNILKEKFKSNLIDNSSLNLEGLEKQLTKFVFDNREFSALSFKSKGELQNVLSTSEYEIFNTANYLLDNDKEAYNTFCIWIERNIHKFTDENTKCLLSKFLFDIEKYELLSYFQEYFIALPSLERSIIELYKNQSPIIRDIYRNFIKENISKLTVQNLPSKLVNYFFDKLEFDALIWLMTYHKELNVEKNLSHYKNVLLRVFKIVEHKSAYVNLIRENLSILNTTFIEEKLIRFLFDNFEYPLLNEISSLVSLKKQLSYNELHILEVYNLLSSSAKPSFIYYMKTNKNNNEPKEIVENFIRLLWDKKMFLDIVSLKEICNYKSVLPNLYVQIIDLWSTLNETKKLNILNSTYNNFVNYLTDEQKNNPAKNSTLNINLPFLEYLFQNKKYDEILEIQSVINYKELLSKEKVRIMDYYSNILEPHTREAFKTYMSKYKSFDFVNENIDVVFELFDRIYHTNSEYLLGIQDMLLDKLKERKDPIKDFTLIEEIFTKNTFPDFIKIYLCFKTIYSDLSSNNVFNFDNRSRLSPVLKNKFLIKEFISPTGNKDIKRYFKIHSNLRVSDVDILLRDDPKKLTKELDKVRLAIIYNDLFRIAIDSNNRSLNHYIDLIEKGNSLYIGMLSNNYNLDNLPEEALKLLNEFCLYLETTYSYTYGKKLDTSQKSLEAKLEQLYKVFIPTKRYDIPDRIVRTLFKIVGIDSFTELKEYILERKNINTIRRIERSKQAFKLEDGDLIRGIGTLKDIPTILNQGNVSKEYLSTINGTTDSDNTPLDIDFSMICKNEYQEKKQENLYDTIGETATNIHYGNIYVVIKKDNPNIYITKDSLDEKVEYKIDKLETFIEPFGPGQYCIRTGMGFSLIDYLLVQTYDDIEVSAIKMELVKNKTYIPIVDMDGNIKFTLEEYEELSKKVSGLSYYGYNDYEFEELQLFDTPSYDLDAFDKDNELREQILLELKDKLNKFVKDELHISKVNNYITGNIGLNSCEVILKGSNARKTSIPGDNLYKVELRIDRRLLDKSDDIIKKLTSYFNPVKNLSFDNHFNAKGVNLDTHNESIDLDIEILQKRQLTSLSSSNALKEKLDSIKKTSTEMYDLVRINIIEAKLLLQSHSINLSEEFIENWILQNGGSLYEACKSLCEASIDSNTNEPLDLYEFQIKYPIWDLGQNCDIINKYQYINYTCEEIDYNVYDELRNVAYDYVLSYDNQFISSKVKVI